MCLIHELFPYVPWNVLTFQYQYIFILSLTNTRVYSFATEPRVLRIETKQVPAPSQPEVVLSDGKSFLIFFFPFFFKFYPKEIISLDRVINKIICYNKIITLIQLRFSCMAVAFCLRVILKTFASLPS